MLALMFLWDVPAAVFCFLLNDANHDASLRCSDISRVSAGFIKVEKIMYVGTIKLEIYL